ncbi:MAG: cyclic nucleotide-binding domain-containing protein [Verrucomicrobia bacterium]|nr:cyclic nucleotide-binding domain-containing protein [Verrucomicrobiota bacterium]
MQPPDSVQFRIIGSDDRVHGPVELPVLVDWLREGRVTGDTWVHASQQDAWSKASRLAELRFFFERRASAGGKSPAPDGSAVQLADLRKVKVLANLTDAQLQRFLTYTEVQTLPARATVVKRGDHGDAIYIVLRGELRVSLPSSGQERVLTTLGPGDFFGEVSLFDHGPRSADVAAYSTSTLLRFSSASFDRLAVEAPDIAASILLCMGKTLASRIRADNKRYLSSVAFNEALGD